MNLHWNTECTNKRRWKPLFRLDLVVFVELWFQHFVEVVEEWRNHDKRANKDSQETEAFLTGSEAVYIDEHDDERFEPDVQEAVDESDVDIA